MQAQLRSTCRIQIQLPVGWKHLDLEFGFGSAFLLLLFWLFMECCVIQKGHGFAIQNIKEASWAKHRD